MATRISLADLLAALREHHGAPVRHEPAGAFELVVYENASYLVSDELHAEVFDELKRAVGVTPEKLLAAKPATIAKAIAKGGMDVDHRTDKVRRAAEVAVDLDAPLDDLVAESLETARKALKKMPSIGPPGADKIALFTGGYQVLPLESNGLRVLQRLGFAKESKDYAKSYRAAQEAIAAELPRGAKKLVDAYLLLRTHGREVCTRTRPKCGECPVQQECPTGRR
jgi:endonuclease III